jgi:hypothetical protein
MSVLLDTEDETPADEVKLRAACALQRRGTVVVRMRVEEYALVAHMI